MKKRLTAVLMSALLGALCLSGCGNDTAPTVAGQTETEVRPEEETERPEVAEAVSMISKEAKMRYRRRTLTGQ